MRADLRRWAEAELMIPDAPVQASRSVAVHASPDVVWRLLTEVSDWPRWHGHLKNARLDGDFVAGTALTYGGPFPHRLRVATVRPGRLAMLYGTLARYTGITRWDVAGVADAETMVTFSESSDGPLIALLYGEASLGRHLDRWLAALKTEAERPAGSGVNPWRAGADDRMPPPSGEPRPGRVR